MMDIDAVTAGIASTATALGGFFGGKKFANSDSMTIASETVDMLSLQVNLLNEKNTRQEGEIADLRTRVDVLQELTTQRANVEAVKVVVDKIADKVGA